MLVHPPTDRDACTLFRYGGDAVARHSMLVDHSPDLFVALRAITVAACVTMHVPAVAVPGRMHICVSDRPRVSVHEAAEPWATRVCAYDCTAQSSCPARTCHDSQSVMGAVAIDCNLDRPPVHALLSSAARSPAVPAMAMHG